jgi:hypothetical protein
VTLTSPSTHTRAVVSSAGGAVLAAGTRAIAALRRSRKPLHPRGEVLTGRIYRHGSDMPTGVPWLDQPGRDEAVVRRSRAIGLPWPLPDIHGMAVRVTSAQGAGDILFASTGWSRLGRFVLTASRHRRVRPMTTLLPYRTTAGPILIGARARGTRNYELFWARRDGPWQTFAELILSGPAGDDQDISFDPVRVQLPGLQQYPFVERLREPAYRRARRARTGPTPDQRTPTRRTR